LKVAGVTCRERAFFFQSVGVGFFFVALTKKFQIITGIAILAILFVIGYGSVFVDPVNYQDFAPYGVSGIFQGAAVVFFAYLGKFRFRIFFFK
jgi:hypothetical protein